MNCPASHDLLQQGLDGTPMESPEWNEHLRGCAECRALASASRRLQDVSTAVVSFASGVAYASRQ